MEFLYNTPNSFCLVRFVDDISDGSNLEVNQWKGEVVSRDLTLSLQLPRNWSNPVPRYKVRRSVLSLP